MVYIIKISVDKIYNSSDVVEKEIMGYQVITRLLNVYTTAINNVCLNKASNYDSLILKTLPDNSSFFNPDLYQRLLSISSYVASLTDSKALLLYKKQMAIIN